MLEPPLARTLAFIRDHRAARGASPTCHEIAKGTGCSVSMAHERVNELIRLGVLRKGAHQWRLNLVPSVEDHPVRVGDVRDVLSTAGLPLPAVNSIVARLIGLSLEDATSSVPSTPSAAGKAGRRKTST